jgi:polyhydroxyalkanoate synthase
MRQSKRSGIRGSTPREPLKAARGHFERSVMSDPPGPDSKSFDLLNLPLSFAGVADRSRRLLIDWLSRNNFSLGGGTTAGPVDIASSFLDLTSKMMADPAKLVKAQMSLWQDYLELWQNTTSRMLGQPMPAATTGAAGSDPRFRDEIWEENNIFNYVKQSYLLTTRWLEWTVRDVDGLDRRTRETVQFYTRQFVSALSPTNFALTNPEVIRTTIETRGENLLNGLSNLLHDLETMQAVVWGSDRAEIGRTAAPTPGKVVFRNELMEVIRYAPTTRRVWKHPLLFIPAWINKYYLFDLDARNSMVAWAIAEGHTVFMISWVDPDGDTRRRGFEDYVLDGTLKAIDVVERTTGESAINAVGYCIGGTLLAATLAYLAKKGDTRVKTATFMTTMMDFSQPGDLGVFVDEATLAYLEQERNEAGGDDAADISLLFNLLREQDLIWSFVVNNYLLGRDSFPFNLLQWNADATHMPVAIHSYYLRNFYQKNKLVEPGGINIGGEAVDLRRIRIPSYVLAAREDHLAPWKSIYKATQILGGPNRFTLTASGHVAGIVNPPAAGKYCYWTNERSPANPDEWLATARRTEGSWWPDWHEWLSRMPDAVRVPANRPAAERLPSICNAPGEYVRLRA